MTKMLESILWGSTENAWMTWEMKQERSKSQSVTQDHNNTIAKFSRGITTSNTLVLVIQWWTQLTTISFWKNQEFWFQKMNWELLCTSFITAIKALRRHAFKPKMQCTRRESMPTTWSRSAQYETKKAKIKKIYLYVFGRIIESSIESICDAFRFVKKGSALDLLQPHFYFMVMNHNEICFLQPNCTEANNLSTAWHISRIYQ